MLSRERLTNMTAFKNGQFGLLWFPSLRGVAYLNVLREINILPRVIITLENTQLDIKDVIEEDKKQGYGEQYFDINYSHTHFAKEFNIPIVESLAQNINDDNVLSLLNQNNIENWLFTGGGILKAPLFENSRRFLHVHPGKLPEYRGSTCFYYSLLKENTLSASAFFLTPSLDNGKALVQCDFNLNMKLDGQHQCFMDYILDPWIRAETLRKALTQYIDYPVRASQVIEHPAESTECSTTVDRTYYVMHPLLRALTINKVNKLFDMTKPKGAFLIE